MLRRTALLVAGLMACALCAPPASALQSLTGTWTGSAVCDVSALGGFDHTKSDVTLTLDDAGDGTGFARSGEAVFQVVVIADPDASGRGRLGGSVCNLALSEEDRALQLVVKAKDGSDKATLAGELISIGFGDERFVQVCKLKLKRTSTTLADPIVCPT